MTRLKKNISDIYFTQILVNCVGKAPEDLILEAAFGSDVALLAALPRH